MGTLARASAPLRCHPGRRSARRGRGRTPASSRNEEPMTVSRIATTNAPAAVGPYSQGVSTGQGAGSLVFVSGQVPLDPAPRALAEGDIPAPAQPARKPGQPGQRHGAPGGKPQGNRRHGSGRPGGKPGEGRQGKAAAGQGQAGNAPDAATQDANAPANRQGRPHGKGRQGQPRRAAGGNHPPRHPAAPPTVASRVVAVALSTPASASDTPPASSWISSLATTACMPRSRLMPWSPSPMAVSSAVSSSRCSATTAAAPRIQAVLHAASSGFS